MSEETLRLFGTLTTDDAAQEWSLALEQEAGFDLDLLAVQTPVAQKLGLYVGDRSAKLKEELFFSRQRAWPVRFELSLTGEGNPAAFTDLVLRDVTIKFIVEGDSLPLALERVRNLTALLAGLARGAVAGRGPREQSGAARGQRVSGRRAASPATR